MAQVPYAPIPNVRPITPGEQVNVSTPPAVFGENIGQAISRLGGQLEQSGGEVFQRAIGIQDLANETEARKADADYGKEQALLHADFLQNRGADARAALPKFLADSDALRTKYREGLSNPAAQRMFDATSLGFMLRNINSGALHAGEQFQQYVGDEAISAAKNEQNYRVDPNDPNEEAGKLDRSRAALQRAAQAKGWGPQRLEEELRNNDSQLESSRIMDISRNGNPRQAWDIYQDDLANHKILQKDADHLRDYIWSDNRTRGARVLVDNIVRAGGSEADMVRQVEQAVNDPKISLGDDLFPQIMRNALKQRQNTELDELRKEFQDNKRTLFTAINSGANVMDDIKHNPATAPAWNNIMQTHPEYANQFEKKFSTYVANRDFETHEKSMNILQTLSRDRPKDFLNVDVFDPGWHLNRQDRQHWLNKQDEIAKNNGQRTGDPYIPRAIGEIQARYASQMKGAGLVDENGRRVEGDDWDAFWGFVDTSIRDYQEQHDKRPDRAALDEIANTAFIKHEEDRNPFMQAIFGKSQVQEFKRTFTDVEKEKGRDELRKANNGIEPNDVQLRRWLIQKQWNQFHQGGATTQGARGGGPAVPAPQ